MNKKCAFTLAEVLITLGIVGVVAALTIPTLIQKTNEKVNIAKWKKTYSTIYNAHNAIKADGISLCLADAPHAKGECTYATGVSSDARLGLFNPEYIKAFLTKLNVAITCGSGSYKFSDYTCTTGVDKFNWEGWVQYATLGGKQVNYNVPGTNLTVKIPSGSRMSHGSVVQSILLKNGVVLYFNANNYGTHICADVDNFSNGPNMLGKDLFCVSVNQDYIVPFGQPNYSRLLPLGGEGWKNCSKDKGEKEGFFDGRGAGCSYLYLTK